MHYEYEYEVNDYIEKLVITRLLELREKYKNDEEIFPKRYERLKKKYQDKVENDIWPKVERRK